VATSLAERCFSNSLKQLIQSNPIPRCRGSGCPTRMLVLVQLDVHVSTVAWLVELICTGILVI
jgi:hypothetical protein